MARPQQIGWGRRGIYTRRTIERVRLSRGEALKARVRRRVSASRSWLDELEFYALPKNTINGTILERLFARFLRDKKLRWRFQHVVDLPQLATARVDFAVFGVGFRPFLVVEPEGAVFHEDEQKDDLRTLQLQALGITAVQVWEGDILQSKERMLKVFEAALLGIEYPKPPKDRAARLPERWKK